MDALTEKQQKVFAYITQYINENSISPTIREIASRFRYKSLRTVQDHLEALKRKGFIEGLKATARGLKIKRQGIPLVGYVQAGVPAHEQFDIYDFINPDAGGDTCALKVKGDSMKDAGIMEGDIVIAAKNPHTVRDGDIVIANVGNESTVKYLRRKGDKFLLSPANRRYKSIAVTSDATISGKVIFVLRKY